MTAPGGPHRAWVEVDHEAIRHNLSVIRGLAPRAAVIGIVKANAYGHGDVAVARTLVAAGVERLGVATVDEAAALRDAGIDVPIVVLWAIGPQEVPVVASLGLEPIVFDRRTIDLLGAAAGNVPIGVHLKLDTGLGRQGAAPAEAVGLAGAIEAASGLRLAGTMTHLAVAGEDEAATEVQLLRLARALDALRSAGIDPGIVHVSASGGILAGHVGPADAIRPGLALYGLLPAGPPTGTPACDPH